MFCIAFSYANLILDASLILFPLLYVKYAERLKIKATDFGLPGKAAQANPVKELGLALKITGALFAVSFALTIILSLLHLNDLSAVEGIIEAISAEPFYVLIYLMVVRVFAEEFFFRAFLVPRMGVIGSSLLFAASHITYGSGAEVIGALALGGVLGHYYSKEKKLLPNFIAHLLYNAVAISLMVAA